MDFSHHSLLLAFLSPLTCQNVYGENDLLFLISSRPRLILCLHYLFGKLIDRMVDPSVLVLTPLSSTFQASTPYSLESESLRMDCIMSGGASPTLAINAVTNKVLSYKSLVLSVPQFTSPL